MSRRAEPLISGEVYHIFTKSIAGFKIFNCPSDYERMLSAMFLYRIEKVPCKLSLFLKRDTSASSKPGLESSHKIVDIIAFCIMPTHIHLVLKQLKDNGISNFVNLILKSYSKYFNKKHERKGPLWESRFKNVLIKTEEQLLHLTRYIHLNPSTAYLINDPLEWEYSSYKEYIGMSVENIKICNFINYLAIDTASYTKFVKDFVEYERNLSKIKHLIVD